MIKQDDKINILSTTFKKLFAFHFDSYVSS